MSKYDFAIDLSDTSSTGIILKKIQPESTVLEFGCATGRMTRYMKQALNCKVYIVEYEQSAFDEAMNYAEDGVCDDLLTLSWLDKFKDIKFDAIIFADVLEHLSDPAKALRGAEQVLKETGHIYVSVPNITHNDILIKAFQNHFDYTKIGLLDDTHVHFWGLDNLVPFMKECGLNVVDLEATYCETGYTEQYTETSMEISPRLLNYFNERIAGNIYQFVMTLGKYGDSIDPIEKRLSKPYIKSHIYLDCGNGFVGDNVLEIHAEMIAPGRYSMHYVLDDVSNVKKLRFDPVELQACILSYVSIRQAGKELELGYNDCIDMESGKLLVSTDPMVCVDIDSQAGSVIIDAEILISSVLYEEQLENLCVSEKQELNDYKRKYDSINEEFQKIVAHNESLQEKKDKLQAELDSITTEYEAVRAGLEEIKEAHERMLSEFNRVAVENAELKADLSSYMVLVDKKDALLIEREQHYSIFVRLKRKIYNILRRIKHKVLRRGSNE